MAKPSFKQPKLFSSDVALQFPTPLMTRHYESTTQLNYQLTRLVMKLEKESPNWKSRTSNIGGFHSGNQFLSRKEDAIVILRDMMKEAVSDFLQSFIESNCYKPPEIVNSKLWGWGIIMRAGDSNVQHVHPDAKVSGVYYAKVPEMEKESADDDPQGAILFSDPRPRAHMNRISNQISEFTIDPKPGMMVVFPSYFEHAVLPFRAEGERICIAFNVWFKSDYDDPSSAS